MLKHLETQEINPQSGSPLYTRIPSEVRNLIFQYALTESPNPDPPLFRDIGVRNDHEAENPPLPMGAPRQLARFRSTLFKAGFDWFRPDNRGIVSIGLLLTCRRAYVETHSLPQLQKEHEFYCYRGPDSTEPFSVQTRAIHRYFAAKLDAPAPVAGLCRRDLVRSVRIFGQMFWLDDTNNEAAFWRLVTETPWFKPVEHLRLTIRRGDWWDWEQNQPLRINPFRGKVSIDQTQKDMYTGDGNPAFQAPVWGLGFQHLPSLKTLTMEFETSEDKKKELEDIVAWAVKWRFPLADGRHLSAAGQPVGKMSYRGNEYHWSNLCEQCNYSGRKCKQCDTRQRCMREGYGPRLYLWRVTWKPVTEGAVSRSV